MSAPSNPGTIFIEDEAARQYLDNISRFDAWLEGTGKVNLTRTSRRVFKAEWDRIKVTQDGKRFVKELEKEQGQIEKT